MYPMLLVPLETDLTSVITLDRNHQPAAAFPTYSHATGSVESLFRCTRQLGNVRPSVRALIRRRRAVQTPSPSGNAVDSPKPDT